MSVIAEAFVRIRPDFRNFSSQTEKGVKSSFGRIVKTLGVTFGAIEGIKFGEEIISHAADVQKQAEAIKNEFGQAGDAILKFGETGAAQLGISAHLADSTAARFGILFTNLGIGNEQAAQMTIGFEKLAGSLSIIRNKDPATVLQALPLAIAGNLRSLKQMGIATDQTQLKIAAFKLGLTQSVTQGLTPTIRAQAIYSIATAHLTEFLEQARSHTHDAATQQRILSAEWDNAKDELGKGLIPTIATLTEYLVNHLPHAIEQVKAAFRGVAKFATPFVHIGQAAVKAIGGIKNALIALFIVLAVAKVAAFTNALIGGFVKAGAVIQATMAEAGAATVAETSTARLAILGMTASLKAALISTGIGILLVAVGLAAAYVITHWEKVKKWFATFWRILKQVGTATWTALRESAKAGIYVTLQYMTFFIQQVLRLASHIPFVGGKAKAALLAIRGIVNGFKPDLQKVGDDIGKVGEKAKKAVAGGAAQHAEGLSSLRARGANQTAAAEIAAAAADQKRALQTSYDNLVKVQQDGEAKIESKIRSLNDKLKASIVQQETDLKDSIGQAKQNLNSLGQSLADQIGQVLDKPLQDAQDKQQRLADRQSLENLRKQVVLPGGKQLSTDPNKALAQLRNLANRAGNINKAAIQDFVNQYQQATLAVRQDQINQKKSQTADTINNLTDAFNRNKITRKQFNHRLLALLKSDGVGYKKAGQLMGSAFANGFRDTVQGVFKQSGAIAAAPQRPGVTGSSVNIVEPLAVLKKDQAATRKIEQQIKTEHGKLQSQISKNTKKAADLLAKIHSVNVAPLPSGKKHGGKDLKTNDLLGNTTG